MFFLNSEKPYWQRLMLCYFKSLRWPFKKSRRRLDKEAGADEQDTGRPDTVAGETGAIKVTDVARSVVTVTDVTTMFVMHCNLLWYLLLCYNN